MLMKTVWMQNINLTSLIFTRSSLTKNHVLWPSPGNHDYANNSARQADHNIAYYDVFLIAINTDRLAALLLTQKHFILTIMAIFILLH